MGVAKEGHWPKVLDQAANGLKEGIEKMDGLEKKEKRLKAWFKDKEKIGTTPCIEPSSAYEALEGLAATLGTSEVVALCLIWTVSSEYSKILHLSFDRKKPRSTLKTYSKQLDAAKTDSSRSSSLRRKSWLGYIDGGVMVMTSSLQSNPCIRSVVGLATLPVALCGR